MDHKLAIEHYNNGLQLAKEEKWDEALELLEKAIAEDPEHVKSYNILGKVYVNKGRPGIARKCWRKSLDLDPDNITARQCLAALSDDKRVIQIDFKSLMWPGIVAILTIALIATNSIMLYRISRLKADLTEALNQIPEESQTDGLSIQDILAKIPPVLETESQVTETYYWGLAACRLEQYDQAMEIFRKILGYSSPHGLKDNAQYWLAECLYARMEYSQALAEFRVVKERYPEANKVFDAELKIAYTYCKLGNVEEARKQLLQLSKKWPHEQYQSQINILLKKLQPK